MDNDSNDTTQHAEINKKEKWHEKNGYITNAASQWENKIYKKQSHAQNRKKPDVKCHMGWLSALC